MISPYLCPFCGSEEIQAIYGKPISMVYFYWVECLGCGARSGLVTSDLEHAIEKWNRRVKEDADGKAR